MKSFFTLLIVFFVFQCTFAQMLVKENARWNVLNTNFFYEMFTVSYKFEGDSVVDNQTYKKLWASYDEDNEFWTIDNLLRETPDGKVFDQDSVLHYDFSLVVGDTIEHIEETNCFYIIEQIDSITLLDGTFRKRWAIRIPEPFAGTSGIVTYWIEGIGSVYTLADYAQITCSADGFTNLLCYYENETLLYQDREECFIITSTDDGNKELFQLKISPNPATDNLNISYSFSGTSIWQNGQCSVLDNQGQAITTFPIGQNHDASMVIPIRGWAKGVYFLQIVTEQGVVKTKKFLVQ